MEKHHPPPPCVFFIFDKYLKIGILKMKLLEMHQIRKKKKNISREDEERRAEMYHTNDAVTERVTYLMPYLREHTRYSHISDMEQVIAIYRPHLRRSYICRSLL